MKAARPPNGFTLMELVVAIALSSMVMIALTTLFLPIVRTQMRSLNDLHSQGDAMTAHRGLLQSLRDASEIYHPAQGSADWISGCSNYDSTLGAPIDGSAPNRSFYYCVAGGRLYYHSQTGAVGAPTACPMSPPSCAAGTFLAANVSLPAGYNNYFVRSARDVIDVHYKVTYAAGSNASSDMTINTAVAFQAASEAP